MHLLFLETSALENSLRNGDQLTLSTQLMKPNFFVNLTPAPQFLEEFARFILKSKQTNTSPHTHTQKQVITKLDTKTLQTVRLGQTISV